MARRFVGFGVAALLVVAASGCGSSGNSVSSRARDSHRSSATAADGSSLRTVEYQGLAFDVPGDWPVYDLAQHPTTCVRFDVHAVYLGTPGADMNCPAGIVGRSDAVLVQAATDQPSANTATASAQDVNGLSVQVANDAANSHEIDATAAGVSATITYNDGDTTAQQILQSFRKAG